MKRFFIFTSLYFSFFATMASVPNPQVIDVGNEIQLTAEYDKKKIIGFKVISMSKDSIYQDMGYKKGDLIQKIDGHKIYNSLQLQSALNQEATEWESMTFDKDFSDIERDIDGQSFEEIEQSF